MALNFLRVRRVPFIRQMEASECGAASLAMVLAYHGHHAPLVEIRQSCGVGRDGVSVHAILRSAQERGMEADAYRLELEEINKLALPAILHWDFNHFLVLERLGRRRALVVDPANGRRWVSEADLNRSFTGVAIVMSPGKEFQHRSQKPPSLERYLKLLKNCTPSLAQILVASFMIQIFAMVFPIFNQLLLDRVIGLRQEPWLWGLGLGMGTAILAKSALGVVRSWVIQNVQAHMDSALLGQFVEHLLHLPLSYFMQRKPGDLLQRIQANTELRSLFASHSVSAIMDVFLLVGYAILMAAYQPWMGILVISITLARLSLLLGASPSSKRLMAAELAASGQESAALLDTLTSLESLKAMKAEVPMINRWAAFMSLRVNIAFQRRRLEVALRQSDWITQGFATAAVFWFGGKEVMSERMTLGVFSSFVALQGMFHSSAESLISSLLQLQYVGNHLERLDDVTAAEREPNGTLEPKRLKGQIDMENVTFAYSPGSPSAITAFTVSIRPGEKIALVGPSGAGKSTLARLLLGMHLPNVGSVRFDGHNLRDLDLAATRRQMGIVLQDTYLLNDTIRANLSLNDPDLSEESLRLAATRACIMEFIESLPQGFDTPLEGNGSRLSGGQRQRLSLARAIAHQPAVLLLDEATSSLDLQTEKAVHRNLAAFGCTRIIIAHRLETLKDADRILVLSEGHLAQEGRFEELSSRPGLFCDLMATMQVSHV